MPREDYTTVDTWQVAGLQGTGSIDVILDDVFVPAHRTQRTQDNFLLKGAGQAVNTSSLYRLPFGQIFVRGISTAALGALQGMLNALIDHGRNRVTRAGGRSAENPFVQLLCAETAAAIDEMRFDAASQFSDTARLCAPRRDAAARPAAAIQVPVDRGDRARTLLAGAHLQGDRRRRACSTSCRSAASSPT